MDIIDLTPIRFERKDVYYVHIYNILNPSVHIYYSLYISIRSSLRK